MKLFLALAEVNNYDLTVIVGIACLFIWFAIGWRAHREWSSPASTDGGSSADSAEDGIDPPTNHNSEAQGRSGSLPNRR
jgi:hypothetical protein